MSTEAKGMATQKEAWSKVYPNDPDKVTTLVEDPTKVVTYQYLYNCNVKEPWRFPFVIRNADRYESNQTVYYDEIEAKVLATINLVLLGAVASPSSTYLFNLRGTNPGVSFGFFNGSFPNGITCPVTDRNVIESISNSLYAYPSSTTYIDVEVNGITYYWSFSGYTYQDLIDRDTIDIQATMERPL